MIKQISYMEVLEKLAELEKYTKKQIGVHAKLEVQGIRQAAACIHANLIRTGEKYIMEDDQIFTLIADPRFRIKAEELNCGTLLKSEFDAFREEILRDGRALGQVFINDAAVMSPSCSEMIDIVSKTEDVVASCAEDKNEVTVVDISGAEEHTEHKDDLMDRLLQMGPSKPGLLQDSELQPVEAEREVLDGTGSFGEAPVAFPLDDVIEIPEENASICRAGISDVNNLFREEFTQHYFAIELNLNSKIIGKIEFIIAPLDPERPEGKFVFWAKQWRSPKGFVGISSMNETTGREDAVYLLRKKNIALRMTTGVENDRFTAHISVESETDITLSISEENISGDKGHIMLMDTDNDVLVHVFPIDSTNSDSGYVAFFCVVEDQKPRAYLFPHGSGIVEIGSAKHELIARWDGTRLLAAIV